MILEVAILNVKPGRSKMFEADFNVAVQYISSTEGYISHSLQKCIEVDNQYILLVEWTSVEAHEVGFRQSPHIRNGKPCSIIIMTPFHRCYIIKTLKRMQMLINKIEIYWREFQKEYPTYHQVAVPPHYYFC